MKVAVFMVYTSGLLYHVHCSIFVHEYVKLLSHILYSYSCLSYRVS